MKIDNSVKSVNGAKGGTATRQSETRLATATPSPTPASSDTVQVQLSPLSAQLQSVEASLAATPAVNAQRVAEIKQAIGEGRFTINPERIAAGLIDSVSQMLGAGN